MALLKILDGIVVANSRKRRLDFFQLGNIAPDGLQIDTALFQAALYEEADEALGEFHDVVEFGVGNLGFDHPELGEMPARLRLLGAKCWTEGIHLAERHRRGFDIKLPRLREVSLLVEIVDGKKRGRSFASGGSDNRRIGQRKSALVKEISRGLDDLGAHTENRGLSLRTHPEVAMLHQEVSAMFLGSDRVGRRFGHSLHDRDVHDIEFVAAVRALVGTYFAFDDYARFLRQGLDRVKHFRRNSILRDNTLNDAGTVAKLGEEQFAALSQVIKPSADRDRLAVVLADFCDSG